LEAHVVIVRERAKQQAAIKRQVKQCLSSEFQIQHSTLEFESDDEHSIGNHNMSVVTEH
jgi:Co/Zn/Cd efflux system component